MQSDAHTIDALADCNNGDHAAHNYNSIDVQIAKASGVYVWDVHGKRYTDCFSAASAVNVGTFYLFFLVGTPNYLHAHTLYTH